MKLSPGDPGRAIAGDLEEAVTFAVALESRGSSVGFEAVELERKRNVCPEAIDLVPAPANLDMSVESRTRKAEAIEENDESILELAAGDTAGVATAAKALANRTGPTPTRVSHKEIRERQAVVEALNLRLPHSSLDGAYRHEGRQVQECARNGRDRDPPRDSHLVCRQDSRVALEVSSRAALRPRCDFDGATANRANPPKRGCRSMTENSARARGEDGRHPPPLPGDDPVPHRVDPGMQAMETTHPQPTVNSARAHPPINKLRSSHRAVLLLSRVPKKCVWPTSL
ncbi:MAG TPA: hypothetical protein VII45_13145 [Solirubrobacterales bacterium]